MELIKHKSRPELGDCLLNSKGNITVIKRKLFYTMIVSIYICSCDKSIKYVENQLNFDLLFDKTGLSYEFLDTLAEKYTNHDKDYQKLRETTLFDPEPELLVPEQFRVYARIRTIEQGGRLADVLYFMHYKNGSYREQLKYKNMYIYYYYQGAENNWKYIVSLSEHTGEILFYLTSIHVSPRL